MQVMPGRAPTRGRAPAPRSVQTRSYAPPVGGLVTNTPLSQMQPGTAYVMDNFRATRRTIKPRGGSNWRVTTDGSDVTALFQYRKAGSETFFVADAGKVYPFTDATADETTLTADITGQSGGDYSSVENTTSGGTYLTIVNGRDSAQIYNGTSWQAVTGASSPIAITGVTTADLSYVWLYRNRQFFIESGTMSAWYLGTNSVGGAATELPLAGVFQKGGALLFGATLSSDSGSGLDDRCVFVTTEGEAAVYTGGDPSSSSDWSLNGIYDIGQPLGAHAHTSLGGDLLIATAVGLIPLSVALSRDTALLSASAVSLPIQIDWQAEVQAGGAAASWRVVKWDGGNELYVAPVPAPSPTPFLWVLNLSTGAWYRFTNWRAGAIAVLDDGLHFGGSGGKVYEGNVGGTDGGSTFICECAMAFDEMGAPGAIKLMHAVRGFWLYSSPINPQHSIAADYQTGFPSAPAVAATASSGGAQWDVALWDVALWSNGSVSRMPQTKWEVVGERGRSFSLQIQMTSGASYTLPAELVSMDVSYSVGEVYA